MLRPRLFLTWIPFVVILVGAGAYGIWLFTRVLNEVDATVSQNHQNATATRTMSADLKLMEKNLNRVLEGDRESGGEDFRANEKNSEASLAVLARNPALFGATNLVSQLQTNYNQLHLAGAKILLANRAAEQRSSYEEEMVPLLMQIRILLEQLGDISDRNILATTQKIQGMTGHIKRVMIIAMAVVLVLSVLTSWQFGRSVLKPIQSLTRAVGEVGQGNVEQTVPILSHDELGELAVAFNRMALQIKTYRQSTAEKIMRLNLTMKSAINSFPDPIFVLDRAGHVEMKNPAAEALTERLTLKGVLPDPLPRMAGDVLKSGEDFLPRDFSQALTLRVAGEERAFLPRILTMRGLTQDVVGVAVVLHDVTRFRLLDDVKTNLLATVSHELKTPLTSVRVALHLLLEEKTGPLTGKQAGLVETARKDAERLLRILNDLLDLTRLEAGQSGLNPERVYPTELVQQICQEARSGVAAQGLTLSNSIEPNLPRVLVDRQRIGHVFHNFIANAIRHSPKGGTVEVRAAHGENGGVQFSVVDQGPGVPPEYDQRIFDRFFRIPGQAKSGAGLGLSIAREIVVAHGGRIGVHSEPGRGSEFYFVVGGEEPELPAPKYRALQPATSGG